MDEYQVELKGFFEYNMMPRVHKVILVGKGFVEDYEIELNIFSLKMNNTSKQKVNEDV